MTMFLNKINKPLNETWNLNNQNYDKEILLATILQKYDTFGVTEEDPRMFKYYSEIWWRKHYRTFEKWFDAFDIPYSPLINNWRSQQHTIEETTEGNTYNRFKNNDSQTDHHIGDAFSNQDYHNEYEDHKVTEEKVDNDTTNQVGKVELTDANASKVNTGNTSEDRSNVNIKDNTTNETTSDTKDTDTKSDVTVDLFGAQYTDEHSKGTTGTFGADAGDMSFTRGSGDTARTTEHRVSAYNETSYQPSSEDIVTGDMGTEGRNTSKTHTYSDADDNNVHEQDDITKDTKSKEMSSGDERVKGQSEAYEDSTNNQSVTSNEIGKGTDDTKTDFKDDTNGENTNNTKTTSNDKYINNSEGLHTGDSQQKTDGTKYFTEKDYHEGNVGTMTAQQMLDSELKIQMIDLYDQIAELFVDENCVCIYLNEWQRGGCCW